MTEAKRNIKVKCPQCHKKFEYYSSDFRPFCSERCRMTDLGYWLNESYSVPAQNNSDFLDEEEDKEINEGFYEE